MYVRTQLLNTLIIMPVEFIYNNIMSKLMLNYNFPHIAKLRSYVATYFLLPYVAWHVQKHRNKVAGCSYVCMKSL